MRNKENKRNWGKEGKRNDNYKRASCIMDVGT